MVYADPPRTDAFQRVQRTLDVRGLEPHVYAESEAAQVQPTLDRMMRQGIVLLADDEGL